MVELYCDICKKRIDGTGSPVVLDHTFGYGTDLDGTTIEIHCHEECFVNKFQNEIAEIIKREEKNGS